MNATHVQLNPQQVEEAKQMTSGKIKAFRKDRLYHNDRERMNYLAEYLRKVRVQDDQNVYNVGNLHGHPNRTATHKNLFND